MRLVVWIFAFFLLVAAAISSADAQDTQQGACYLGFGKTLEAAPSRQLSLNANISQFLYQPGGLEIAYAGSQTDGDAVTSYIRLVGVKHGSVATLISTSGKTDASTESEQSAPYTLAGWSADARYLLLQKEWDVPTTDAATGYMQQGFVCVDVGADPIHIAPIVLPDMAAPNPSISYQSIQDWWSPDRTHILFADEARIKDGKASWTADLFCVVYDPKTDRFQTITESEKQAALGWIDGSHILLGSRSLPVEHKSGDTKLFASVDIATGSQAVIPKPAKMPGVGGGSISDLGTITGTSPKATYVILEDQSKHIEYAPKAGAADCHMLWVVRTQGPKPQSAASVGVTPGTDNPQAAWSPTGAQIAYISHGDLFVTDLTVRNATVPEKYAAGETLTCAEEQVLAAVNLKQIGLAALQYSQDHDEQLPSGDGWQNQIEPYLKDDSLFSIGGHPVVYHAPPNLSLASIDNPADSILATVDLPCATVNLYNDGHVKSFPKQDNSPANRK